MLILEPGTNAVDFFVLEIELLQITFFGKTPVVWCIGLLERVSLLFAQTFGDFPLAKIPVDPIHHALHCLYETENTSYNRYPIFYVLREQILLCH